MAQEGLHVAVIVLGDTGRSPRMQFHAQSFAEMKEVERVSLVGYEGETCNKGIEEVEKIRDWRLPSSWSSRIEWIRGKNSLLHAAVKGVLLIVFLVKLLMEVASEHTHNGKHCRGIPISFVIVQNPPGIPVICALVLYRLLLNVKRVFSFSNDSSKPFEICIDWHNLGFTLYYDRYHQSHILIKICYTFEYLMSKISDVNLCVSSAMQKWLKENYSIDSTVFYDRPPRAVFQRFGSSNESECLAEARHPDFLPENMNSHLMQSGVPVDVRHELLLRLNLTDDALFPQLVKPGASCHDGDIFSYTDMTENTIHTFRHRLTGKVHFRHDRAVLLMSSTSWTPDEDFSLLTKAITNLDRSISKRRGSESPRLKQDPSSFLSQRLSNLCTRVVVVITGKGPLKEKFMAEWNKSQEPGSPSRLRYITLTAVWLKIEDYPLMVGCADMGICLHTSSSGVDLPMKVLDMFGCGVPVCAVSFPALPELVQNGSNGIIFRTASELSAHLFRLFCDFPRNKSSLEVLSKMKRKTFQIGCWEDNWINIVRPIVLKYCTKEKHIDIYRYAILIAVLGLLMTLLTTVWR